MSIPRTLSVEAGLCTACRACEMACHYHHLGTFGAEAASILIDFNADSGEVRIQFDSSCDDCSQESGPQCARYCGPGAIRAASTQQAVRSDS
jgi:Fe-S-cluster-containing hydrogenase component 2